MILGTFSEFSADFAFQARENEPIERILDDLDEELPVGMIGHVQVILGDLVGERNVGLDTHAKHVGLFPAIDREHAMRRYVLHRFLEVVVRLVLLPLPLGQCLDAHRNDHARVPGISCQGPARIG